MMDSSRYPKPQANNALVPAILSSSSNGTPADLGNHRQGRPATISVTRLPTPQFHILGPPVDDIPVVIDWDQLLTSEERHNMVFLDIQFAMEEEENNQMAFLDVLVCRNDFGGVKTK
ncbi:hypothetical protein SprV_0602174600 [Sparganum proliferum]